MPISERNLFHIQKPVPDPVQEIKSRGGTWKGRKSFPHRKFVFSICLYLSLLSTFLFEAARLPKWSVRRSGNVEIDRRKWAANSDSMFQSYEVLGSFPCSKASLSNHSILAPSDQLLFQFQVCAGLPNFRSVCGFATLFFVNAQRSERLSS